MSTRLLYTAIWGLVLGMKISFDYFLVVQPVAAPTRALWAVRARSWTAELAPTSYEDGSGDTGSLETGNGRRLQAPDLDTALLYCYRSMLVLLRWSTPVLLVFGDTVMFFNFIAASLSAALAYYVRIYETSTWSQARDPARPPRALMRRPRDPTRPRTTPHDLARPHVIHVTPRDVNVTPRDPV
eukprot:4382809-Prymnesium_polylepis.2